MAKQDKYVIIREDLMLDPVTLVTDGLLIGRLFECDLLLNHPAVSRAQAGIRSSGGDFYLFNLRKSNPVKLNGKVIEQNSALAAGDILELGPFLLEIDYLDNALVIKVSLHIGMVVVATDFLGPHIETETLVVPGEEGDTKTSDKPRPAPLPKDKALDIFWDKRIREAGKIVRASALFPRGRKKAGKAQFNWAPTSDLTKHWPASFLIWGAVGVGLMSVAAAFWYTSAYAPGPVSYAHSKATLDLSPPIALRANANSCTSCHSLRGSMEFKCAACHTTPTFVATVTTHHSAAGIGCVSCHEEHGGSEFQPAVAATTQCATCHNDTNHQTYNGHQVRTPHGGTFGYPVVDGLWKWKGFADTDWALKKIPIGRLPEDTDEKWRSKQFHALHMYRVLAAPGMSSNADKQLSCSSCHQTREPIDRVTPRTTCRLCHSRNAELATTRSIVEATNPDCYSCHVEHANDTRRWNKSLLAAPNTQPREQY